MDVDEPRPSNFSSIGSRNGMHKSVLSGKAGSGVKKLVIRNAKASTLPENFYGSTWAQLREAIDAVHESRSTRSNLEDLYGCVESICTHNLSARLYDDLRMVCHQKVCKIAHQLSINQSDQFEFLASVGHEWEQHCRQMVMIRSIFLVIDRKYTLQTAGINSLWEVGLELFRQCVLCGGGEIGSKGAAVCVRTVDGILALLQKERLGELVNSSLIKCLLRMLSDLHIYGQFFEARFLDATEHLYRYEGLELMATLDTTEYLRRVSRRLIEEEERATRYLDHSTRKPLVRTVEKQLLEAHVDEILAKGFSNLVSENRVVELKSLFELFQRAKALQQLKNSFSEYIKLTGSSIVMNPSNDEQMVSELLAFKDKVDSIAQNCFANMELYTLAIREAFENFINKRQNKPAEMIAKYIDTRLKSGNKESSEEELEKLMDKVMVIFRFIHGKDVFEAFYKKDLAKRLLVGRSASVDAEKSMLSKLKQECGAQFTSKLEGMFKDIELSRDIMTNFKLHLESRTKANEEEETAAAAAAQLCELESGDRDTITSTPPQNVTDAVMGDEEEEKELDTESKTRGLQKQEVQQSTSIGGQQRQSTAVVSGDIELVVSVLTMGFWPTYPAIEVNLPKDMEQYLECFKQFYLAKHSGRKLKWQSTLGHCIVKAKFSTGMKELHVSLFQALVMLMFNSGDTYTYQQMKEHTNVEDGELIRTVQSLSLGKKDSRVLRKEPMGKEVALTDTFSIVNDFQNKHFRIKINQIQLKETKQEAETTQEQVFADRVYQVDAAVVRIMKTRKTLIHNELVTQLIHQLRFPVKASDLKKRIESLIEREYMKRDTDNVNSYIYVA